MNEIGFVLTYLDSYDIEWQCKKNKYIGPTYDFSSAE